METKKMSLANIQGKLNRSEMKSIMAGSGAYCTQTCQSSDDCKQSAICKTCGTDRRCF